MLAKRSWMINKQHLAQLIKLGLVEMREDVPHLTIVGQKNHLEGSTAISRQCAACVAP